MLAGVPDPTTVRLDPRLVEEARQAAGLPADSNTTQVVRYALAKLAGLADALAATVARIGQA